MKKILISALAVTSLSGLLCFTHSVAAGREKDEKDVIIQQVRVIAKPSPSATPSTMHVTQFHLFNPEYIKKVLESLNPEK